jgi:hypothetical protein
MVPPTYGIMGGMEKTTVYLTSEQKAALAQAARAVGRSEATLIREGVDEVIGHHAAAEPPGAVAASPYGRLDGVPQGSRPFARPRWIERASFVQLLLRTQADSALARDLNELAPGTTDDEPLP